MLRHVTKWQKILHTYVKMIYDYYHDPYDFSLDTTLNNFPSDEEAREAFNRLNHTMLLKNITGDFPFISIEQVEERAKKENFTAYRSNPPKEYKTTMFKKGKMPYRMMSEYVDRKKKVVRSKSKRCSCKK